MKTVGIICELNPFHNGHAYLMSEAKRITGADRIVLIMSGDFTQRGIPAVMDKYARAEIALNCGADLVLELPVFASTASADDFAQSAVNLFASTGIIDVLCFGSEGADYDLLSKIASLSENFAFRKELKEQLKGGKNYPAAYSSALKSSGAVSLSEEELEIASRPNNQLAVSYLKALFKVPERLKAKDIDVCVIQRIGEGYLSEEIRPYASATALRPLLSGDLTPIRDSFPEPSFKIMKRYLLTAAPLYLDDFSEFINYRLMMTEDNFEEYCDVTRELSDKLKKRRLSFTNTTSLIESLKTKEITHARISRCLLHIFLDMKKTDMELYKSLDLAPYLRPLGVREDAMEVLTEIKRSGKLPLLSKIADAGSLLTPDAYALLKKDLTAAELYRMRLKEKSGYDIGSDVTRGFLIVR